MQIFMGLGSLGVRKEQYDSFLLSIIMSKLPTKVHLQIALVSVKDAREVEELMIVIKGRR